MNFSINQPALKFFLLSLLLIIFFGIVNDASADKIIIDRYLSGNPIEDPNYSFNSYRNFLIKLKSIKKVKFVYQKDFDSNTDSSKIIVSIRHDIDVNIDAAIELAKIEKELNIVSTYFVLHTASYYPPKHRTLLVHSNTLKEKLKIIKDECKFILRTALFYLKNPKKLLVHDNTLIENLKIIQDDYNHEIGFHNDLIILQILEDVNTVDYLHQELKWLRSNGIRIYGTASHGSSNCNTYGYLNTYFFSETIPDSSYKNFNYYISKNKRKIPIMKASLKDFDFTYEAYSLKYNKYYSDCNIVDGKYWNTSLFNPSDLKPGDKVIFLIHPTWWH